MCEEHFKSPHPQSPASLRNQFKSLPHSARKKKEKSSRFTFWGEDGGCDMNYNFTKFARHVNPSENFTSHFSYSLLSSNLSLNFFSTNLFFTITSFSLKPLPRSELIKSNLIIWKNENQKLFRSPAKRNKFIMRSPLDRFFSSSSYYFFEWNGKRSMIKTISLNQ